MPRERAFSWLGNKAQGSGTPLLVGAGGSGGFGYHMCAGGLPSRAQRAQGCCVWITLEGRGALTQTIAGISRKHHAALSGLAATRISAKPFDDGGGRGRGIFNLACSPRSPCCTTQGRNPIQTTTI